MKSLHNSGKRQVPKKTTDSERADQFRDKLHNCGLTDFWEQSTSHENHGHKTVDRMPAQKKI